MSLWARFEEATRANAGRPAYAAGPGLDYAALRRVVLERAAFFHERGLAAGDRLAVCLANGPEFLELYLAAAALGAILVPLNVRLGAAELRAVLEDAAPRWLVRGAEARAELEQAARGLGSLEGRIDLLGTASDELPWSAARARPAAFTPPSLRGDAIAQLYYTSGTSGRPKGVPLSHANVLAHAAAAIAEFALEPSDVWGHLAPMFHLADAWAVFAVSFAGGSHSFLPRFEARAAFETLERDGVTLTNLVPTMLNLMLHAPEAERSDTSSLRLLLSGGAPIAPELVQRLEALFGCSYAQTYGLTETSPFLTVSLPRSGEAALPVEEAARARARSGRPFGGIELRVVDAQGHPVPADDRSVGEIQARGAWVFGGYWRQPEESAAAFTEDWFRTGDLATLDARGSLDIVDRKKDVILSGGETIYSTEVENALYTHRLVREVAVFGLPDELWGEVVCAAVVRAESRGTRRLEVAELIAHCRLFLAGYKLPRRIKFLDELPKSGSGKLQKRKLREQWRELGAADFDYVHGGGAA